MRTVPTAVTNYLLANNVCWQADLFTFTCSSAVFYWTNFDTSLTIGGHTFVAGGGESALAPIVSRGSYRQSSDLSVDTIDIELLGPWSYNSKTLGQLGVSGFFDGALINIDKLIMPNPGDVSLGAITAWFAGTVAGVEPQGPNLKLRCKSALEALGVFQLPRFLLQPQCGNALYDVNCGISKAGKTLSGTVSSATKTTVTTATAGITAKAAGYFDLGMIVFTSGALGLKRFAVSAGGWDGSTFKLALPMSVAPSAGDTFNVYPGCDRSYATCNTKYSNLAQFRGFAKMPAPEAGST